jgi:hypothetical protein
MKTAETAGSTRSWLAITGIMGVAVVGTALFLSANPLPEENTKAIPRRIADAYGASSFSKISKLRYTFNVVRDTFHVTRFWMWEPKANQVTFGKPESQDKPVTYVRAKAGDTLPGPEKAIDKMFINDQYWFLFPLHLVWDSMQAISIKENQSLPIGTGSMMEVTVSYPKSGGYTPGDAFDLFIDKDYHIAQWRYWRGGEKMLVTSEWQHNTAAGPLLFSLDRPGNTRNFKVWFTDVAVMLDGSSSWIQAK